MRALRAGAPEHDHQSCAAEEGSETLIRYMDYFTADGRRHVMAEPSVTSPFHKGPSSAKWELPNTQLFYTIDGGASWRVRVISFRAVEYDRPAAPPAEVLAAFGRVSQNRTGASAVNLSPGEPGTDRHEGPIVGTAEAMVAHGDARIQAGHHGR
jgi:hypothetical protein